ncbi:hypothetical protein [uncultured Roseibium sp.]|uniref:hypothetical protein n=1 Tax=uncultured Roseibium sp. TaxID=1936171 RepID=UPI00261F9A3F|nr:hypothetical protein [uncultured Roseibium sp.]
MNIMSKTEEKKEKKSKRISIITSVSENHNETGFGSVETCEVLFQAISEVYQNVSFHNVTNIESLHKVAQEAPDLVVLCSKYIIVEGTDERIWLSDFFSSKTISFTGSTRSALELDSNKSKAKTLLQNFNIATASFFVARPDQYKKEVDLPLGFPLFIKPISAANGNGVDEFSIVRDLEGYQSKVGSIFASFGTAALVEKELSGKEYTIAILDDPKSNARYVMPLEITTPKNCNGDRLLGYQAKQDNEELLRRVPEPLHSELCLTASKIFDLLNARDFGRIDIKLDEYGTPHFLEANLVPGMTPGSSYFPRALSYLNSSGDALKAPIGLTYSEVALKIVEIGLKRASATVVQ